MLRNNRYHGLEGGMAHCPAEERSDVLNYLRIDL